MTTATTMYELRVGGHLDDHWSAWFGDLTLVRQDDGTTVLTGPITDQARLHGVLAAVRDLAVPLLSLQARGGAARSATGMGVSARAARPALDHPLRTERLTLRPARANDVYATWMYRRLESVGQWLTESYADREAYRVMFTDPGRLANTIVVELDGNLIGDLMLRIEDARSQAEVAEQARGRQAELAGALDPSYPGSGYATEAVRRLITHGFTTLGMRRIVATCFLADHASWRLMERVGMRREAHAITDVLHRSGQWLDTVTYAVLAGEWPR